MFISDLFAYPNAYYAPFLLSVLAAFAVHCLRQLFSSLSFYSYIKPQCCFFYIVGMIVFAAVNLCRPMSFLAI